MNKNLEDLTQSKDIPDQYKRELILYTLPVWKYKIFGLQKARSLYISRNYVFLFKKHTLRRALLIRNISGVTKSAQGGQQLVIHMKDDSDLRLGSQRPEELIDYIKKMHCYVEIGSLDIFAVRKKSLSSFTTTKKDMKKNISRMPLQSDLLKDDNAPKTLQAGNGVSVDYDALMKLAALNDELADYNCQLEERADAYLVNCMPQMISNKGDNDLIKMQKQLCHSTTIYQKEDSINVSLEDFELKKVIGRGSFGKVFLVQHKASKKFYALKSIRKDVVINKEQLKHLKTEKEVLQKAEHPFLMNMQYVFQNKHRIYFLMDFMKGGELYRYLKNELTLQEDHAKFYVIQVALGLSHLHSKNIIYRDLKPENILLGDDGYVKLADFGLSKLVEKNEQANSFCGTPEYMAPEVVNGSGHDYSADWWTLGALIYELIVGIPPFYSNNKHKLYQNIEKEDVKWPQMEKHGFEITSEAKDLISKLLTKDKNSRLGIGGLTEILMHPWFGSVKKDDIVAKTMKAPYVPDIRYEADTSHFDSMFLNLEAAESMIGDNEIRLIEQYSEEFRNF